MRIVSIRERTVSLASAARNSSIQFDGMTASAIAIHTDARKDGRPLIGLAFDSIGRYGHGALLRERFMPRLLEADLDEYTDGSGGIDPHRAWNIVMKNEKPGGHGERCGAVGLLDAALWDLVAKTCGEPLWAVLAKRHGCASPSPKIAVYCSGGHYRSANDVPALCEDIRRAIGQGHRGFKIKIGGAGLPDDLKRIEAVLSTLDNGMSLAVDGNGTFDRDTVIEYLEALAPYHLSWIEEPVNPLDFELHRDIATESPLPLATGENLFSRDDALNLVRYAGLRKDRDTLQFDISLSYGVVEYVRILDNLKEHGWQRDRFAPHAGHLLAMNAVAGLGLGLAEVAMDPSTLFGALTAAAPVRDGIATLPEIPGVGFERTSVFTNVFSDLLN
jgi:D(-)-tartrate dehydratase